MSHPFWFAMASGAFAGGWTGVIVHDWRPVTAAAVGVSLLVWLAWSHRWGWSRREAERLYDENGTLKESA